MRPTAGELAQGNDGGIVLTVALRRQRLESRPLDMLYQVLTRRNDVAQWRCVTLPTSDLRRARLDLHSVKRYNAGAMLIAAESLPELARLTQRLRDVDGDQFGDQYCAP